jgi:flavin-dependent dehydrogenase
VSQSCARLVDDVDVAITGGGPAGAALALRLSRAQLRVAVIERARKPAPRAGESLSPAVTPLLKELGLFHPFLETKPRPCYGNRSVWGGDGTPAEYHFIRDRNGHGWHIDRPAFERMLLEEARAAGVICFERTRLVAIERDADRSWRLHLEQNGERSTIMARFAVDASGPAAAIGRRLGARRLYADRLAAVTAFLTTEDPPCVDSTTLVEAVDRGWWYSAPIPDGGMVVSFMTDPDQLALLRAWETRAWLELLARTADTQERVASAGYRPPVQLNVRPASTSLLQPCSGDGWLAVGDAAAAFDPLTSCGIGTALAGAMQAAPAIEQWLRGIRAGSNSYGSAIESRFYLLLPLLRAYYADETRWIDSPFWGRRRAPLADDAKRAAGAAVRG